MCYATPRLRPQQRNPPRPDAAIEDRPDDQPGRRQPARHMRLNAACGSRSARAADWRGWPRAVPELMRWRRPYTRRCLIGKPLAPRGNAAAAARTGRSAGARRPGAEILEMWRPGKHAAESRQPEGHTMDDKSEAREEGFDWGWCSARTRPRLRMGNAPSGGCAATISRGSRTR